MSRRRVGPYIAEPLEPRLLLSFVQGEVVEATTTLRVRSSDSTLSMILTNEATGNEGIIQSGPYSNQGFNWYDIDWNDGYDGYSVDSGLAAVVLPPPTLNSPGSSSPPGQLLSTFTPTLNWNPVTGASSYNVYVATYPSGTVVADGNVTTTSASIGSGSLQYGAEYDWYVATVNPAGEQGNASSQLYFQEPLPSAPTLISPGSSSSPGPVLATLTPTLNWTAVNGAVIDNGSVNIDYPESTTFGANISGTGTLTMSGSGTAILTGTNTYTVELR
jgi:hypothetical protein